MSHESESDRSDEIAIIGMAAKFPGANNTEAFWQNLRDGVESVTFFSDEELAAAGVAAAVFNAPNYVRARAILNDLEWFDAAFFGFNTREAEIMDPQHRHFLESAWEALEDAGYNPDTYGGAIGVFAGSNFSSYLLNLYANVNVLRLVGQYRLLLANDKDYLTTLTAYKLNLKGPSVTVQTACSTSLVALHLACQSLLNGECDLALAGGVAINAPQKAGYFCDEGGIASPDGHCRTFDQAAQGTLAGNGVGVVVLKRLSDALADGDGVEAVIKASAINNDGAARAGYTAPSLDGQAQVITEAISVAGINAESITYVEAHGTATPLGDPIEVAALTKAFRAHTVKQGFCAIGSVKTNIGHLDAAAGVAGLIKTVLALKHRQIPPSLHFIQPNPKIDFASSPFYVNTRLADWPAGQGRRRAGLSSFGIGGTNAHAILEEAPPRAESGPSRPHQLLLLSAKTDSALATMTANLAAHLRRPQAEKLADVAYTLQVGRRAFGHRRMLVCDDLRTAAEALEAGDGRQVLSGYCDGGYRPVAFMFPGQGAQHVNMGLALYDHEQTYREQVDSCAEILKPYLGVDIRRLIYPKEGDSRAAAEPLNQTFITQPALFVVEYALARLLMEWGLRPEAMIGHSIGEYVAACIAEVFSLEDALRLVAARGKMMQNLAGGRMIAVGLDEAEVEPLLEEAIALAAVNAPGLCVLSGGEDAINQIEARLLADGIFCQPVMTSHAFHSPLVEPMLEEFAKAVRRTRLKPPKINYISNVSGKWITKAEATSADYWVRHLRATVRFSDGVKTLSKISGQVSLEVGPGQVLQKLVLRHAEHAANSQVWSCLNRTGDPASEMEHLLKVLGKAWLAGVEINWGGFYAHERRQRLRLPTYPFERQRYWLDSSRPASPPHRNGHATVDDTDAGLALEHILGEQLSIMGRQLDLLRDADVTLNVGDETGSRPDGL